MHAFTFSQIVATRKLPSRRHNARATAAGRKRQSLCRTSKPTQNLFSPKPLRDSGAKIRRSFERVFSELDAEHVRSTDRERGLSWLSYCVCRTCQRHGVQQLTRSPGSSTWISARSRSHQLATPRQLFRVSLSPTKVCDRPHLGGNPQVEAVPGKAVVSPVSGGARRRWACGHVRDQPHHWQGLFQAGRRLGLGHS